MAAQVEPSLWNKLKQIWQDKNVYEDSVIRQLVSPQNMANSTGNKYNGYSDGATGGSIASFLGSLGSSVGQLFAAPGFDQVRLALPMIQGFTSLVIIIGLPIIMVLSGYSLSTMVTVAIIQIAVFFLSFWWELARWFDWWFLRSVEDQYSWGLFIIGNDDVVLKIVISTMFLILPTLWFMIMTWAGFKGGDAVANMIRESGKSTKDETQKFIDKHKPI